MLAAHGDSPVFHLASPPAGYIENPYPALDTLREQAPVCAQPDGSWILSRHQDVHRVLTDSEAFSSDKTIDFRPRFGDSPLYEHHTMSLVFSDAPYHARVRRLLAPFFAAQTLRRLQAGIAAMVDGLLDAGETAGTIDLVPDLAIAVPLNLIGDLLGVPREEREPLRRWAALILGALEPACSADQLAAGNRAVVDFKRYLRDLIAWKRRHPAAQDDLDILRALIAAHDAGEGLTELEIIHNCIFMLNAGHDTTTSLIGNGVDLLLRHPEQRHRLQREPRLLKSAIEEMLRMESPLQFGNRRSRVAAEIGGVTLPAGSFLHLAIAAANRDPRVFADPARFDIARDPNRHLAFGHGPHFCAGNAVARMEAAIVFERLLARFPHFERDGPTLRSPRSRFRVVASLPLRLGAGRAG